MADDIVLDPDVTEITLQAEALRTLLLKMLTEIEDLKDRVDVLETS
jgi:hypothetical protein